MGLFDNLSREAKVSLFAFGVAQWFNDNGLSEGSFGGMDLTQQGIFQFDQLEASGFRPNKKEIKNFVKYMEDHEYVEPGEQTECLEALLTNWDDIKKNINKDMGFSIQEEE